MKLEDIKLGEKYWTILNNNIEHVVVSKSDEFYSIKEVLIGRLWTSVDDIYETKEKLQLVLYTSKVQAVNANIMNLQVKLQKQYDKLDEYKKEHNIAHIMKKFPELFA